MGERAVDVALLNYFKDLYNGHKIIYVRFRESDFVFRSLDRKEYKYIMAQNSDRMDIEDALCNTACVFPEEYDFTVCGFAGLNPKVAEVIERVSGFSDIQVVLNEYREFRQQNTLELQCMDLIKAFIPEYTYEEMETWPWTKLMKYTARAEKVAALKGFDWHIEDKSEDYLNSLSRINSDNKEFVAELQKNGVDPMFYFASEFQNIGRREILDFPLIGGTHWNDEVILDAIRKQITAKKIAESKG